jgi:hypothetical protein
MTLNLGIFISHSWGYDAHYDTLAGWFREPRELTATREPIVFHDHSVPKSDPIHHARTTTDIANALGVRIKRADVIVVPTALYATHSDWMKFEIDIAGRMGKGIVAINPRGQERKSASILAIANEEVGWTKDSVINAVWRLGQEKAWRT